MSRLPNLRSIVPIVIVLFFMVLWVSKTQAVVDYLSPQPIKVVFALSPKPPQSFTRDYLAALSVARIFAKTPGCTTASPELITEVAHEAVEHNLDATVFAATIATESACNQFAVSKSGAIGYTQVVPRIWKTTYDFEKQYNLFNAHDNLHVGALILSGLIKKYGLTNGLRHYNGLDTASVAYDATYPSRIETRAHTK